MTDRPTPATNGADNDYVFVSYSSRDRESVFLLIDRMREAGLSVWVDQEGIDGGAKWTEEIVNAIRNCKVFLFMLSEDAVVSKNTQRELVLAAEADVSILPVYLTPVEPPAAIAYHLAGIHHVRLLDGPTDRGVRAILRAIKRAGNEAGSGAVKEHEPGISLPALPRKAVVNRLTLKSRNGALLHIIGTPVVQLGKNRHCEIVTRIMNEENEATSEQNAMISRFHCQIQNTGRECSVVDVGFNKRDNVRKASACGVFLDGVRVQPGESAVMPADRILSLSLGNADPDDPQAFAFQCRVWTCNALDGCKIELHGRCRADEPACVVLKRHDAIPETFVLLRRFCSLRTLDSEVVNSMPNICIFRHNNAFGFCSAGQGQQFSGWLVPGDNPAEFPGGIDVVPFKQFGRWA